MRYSLIFLCLLALASPLTSCRSTLPPLAPNNLSNDIVINLEMVQILEENIPREWLQKEVTVQEAWDLACNGESVEVLKEWKQAIADESGAMSDPDMVEAMNFWSYCQNSVKPPDEIWYWSSPPETWKAKCGRAGIVVIHNGRFVRAFPILMN